MKTIFLTDNYMDIRTAHLCQEQGWQPLMSAWGDKNLKCLSKEATKELRKESGSEWLWACSRLFTINVSRSVVINYRKGTVEPTTTAHLSQPQEDSERKSHYPYQLPSEHAWG